MIYNKYTEIIFGHEGEKGFREVRFDVSELPEGVLYLEHLRYGDTYAYPIRLERVGDEAVWIPNETDTAKRGTGKGQLVCYVGDEVVAKTDVFKLINRYSLATTDEVPDGYDSWIQRLESLGADIEGKTTGGLNAINEAKDSALDRISTVSADGIEAINTAKTQGVNAVNSAKTDSLDAIEQKKEAVHTELDGYVEAHHDELKGEKGDAYVVTEEDLKEIGDRVEAEYEPQLNGLKSEVSAKAEATDLALANRKIKALTDVLNGKELAFETTDYESAKVDVPSGAVADSILKIGGKSVVSKNRISIDSLIPYFGRYEQRDEGMMFVPRTTDPYWYTKGLPLNYDSQITVSAMVKNITGTNFRFRIANSDGTISEGVGTGTSNDWVKISTTTAVGKKPTELRCNYGDTGEFLMKDLQLEIGSTATDYEPYFEGIRSSQIECVEVDNSIVRASDFKKFHIEAGENFAFTGFGINSENLSLRLYDKDKESIDFWVAENRERIITNSYTKDVEFVRITKGASFVTTDYIMSIRLIDEEYSKQTIPTNLPPLRSAGSVHDSIEGGKLIRRVGVVDMGTLNWTFIRTEHVCYAELSSKAIGTVGIATNIISTYPTNPLQVDYTGAVYMIDGMIASGRGTSTPYIYFKGDASPSGMLYYEVAEPIIEDLSLPADLEAINVEAGGEISFIDNSDMSFAIPSTHEWVVRNSEV